LTRFRVDRRPGKLIVAAADHAYLTKPIVPDGHE
jgi:hypothetical protein